MTALALVVATILVVAAVGVRVTQVHEVTGEWGLIVGSATPERISALGRDYDRGTIDPTSRAGSELEAVGRTDGGGTILVPAGLRERTPVVVYVRDRDGGLWTYGLVGGL